MNTREKTIETDGREPLMDALKLVGICRRDWIPNYRGILELGLTNVKYSTYKQFREQNLKVMERIKPNKFMQSENMKSTLLRKYDFESIKHVGPEYCWRV
jgi:hypothetical protein